MPDEKKVEAVLIKPSILKAGDPMDQARKIAAGIFGFKPGEGQVNFVRDFIDGMIFARRSAQSPGYLFPTGHSLEKTPRYDWKPATEDGRERPGIFAGALLDDPDAEPAG